MNQDIPTCEDQDISYIPLTVQDFNDGSAFHKKEKKSGKPYIVTKMPSKKELVNSTNIIKDTVINSSMATPKAPHNCLLPLMNKNGLIVKEINSTTPNIYKTSPYKNIDFLLSKMQKLKIHQMAGSNDGKEKTHQNILCQKAIKKNMKAAENIFALRFWQHTFPTVTKKKLQFNSNVLKMLSDEENNIMNPFNTIPPHNGDVYNFRNDHDNSLTQKYFETSVGKFFIDIGMNLVQNYVQHDLIVEHEYISYKKQMLSEDTKCVDLRILSIFKSLEITEEKTAVYKFRQNQCKFCNFKTESTLVMGRHMEVPHIMKKNVYICNFCPFVMCTPEAIIFHMNMEHNIHGRMDEMPVHINQCSFCPFDSDSEKKMTRHSIVCEKKYKPECNLVPFQWDPPGLIRIPKAEKCKSKPSKENIHNQKKPDKGNNHNMQSLNQISKRLPPETPHFLHKDYSVENFSNTSQCKSPTYYIICELCDIYVKNLNILHQHFQCAHRIQIPFASLQCQPILACQYCKYQFFTEPGLDRHLLGAHGLVTASIVYAAKRGDSNGHCPICSRYTGDLLQHIVNSHNISLRDANLSYKCTLCPATYDRYLIYHMHMYSTHKREIIPNLHVVN